MNFVFFTYMGGGGRGYNIHTRHFWRFFILICTHHILSYLFFSEYKRWDSIFSSNFTRKKLNEPKSGHALLPHRQFFVQKDTIFLEFFSSLQLYTLKCFFLTRISWLAKKRGRQIKVI